MAQKISSPFGGYYIYPDDPQNLFQQLLGQKPHSPREGSGELTPEVDIYEDSSSFYAAVEIPGVEKSNLNISCTENTVTINAQVERVAREGGHWVQHERRMGNYVRNIRFTTVVDADNISASYDDGILNLTIPKQTADHKTVSISID